jgi:hypothetical protein
LFSYVDLEARVPSDHPLRAIRVIVNEALAELSPIFAKLYAPLGRPSVKAAECWKFLGWGGAGGRRRPRLGVQRPSVSICARLASDQASGTEPALTVAFSPRLSRGRRASTTVASTIWPPTAFDR